jgi:hypothetical protein
LIVAASTIPRREELSRIEEAIGTPIELCLTTKNSLSFAIKRGYERLDKQEHIAKPRLGQLLLYNKMVTEEQLSEALKRQRRTYSRLGDILLDESMISSTVLNKAFEGYAAVPGERLGDFLVNRGDITKEQLNFAMELQKKRFKSLGQVLTEMRIVAPDAMASIIRGINNT